MVGSGTRSQSKSKEDGSQKVAKVSAKKKAVKEPKKAAKNDKKPAASSSSSAKLLVKTKKKAAEVSDVVSKRVDLEEPPSNQPKHPSRAKKPVEATKGSAKDQDADEHEDVPEKAAKPAMRPKSSNASSKTQSQSDLDKTTENATGRNGKRGGGTKSKEDVQSQEHKRESSTLKTESPKARSKASSKKKADADGKTRVRGRAAQAKAPVDADETSADGSENEAPRNRASSSTKAQKSSPDATDLESDENVDLSEESMNTNFDCTADEGSAQFSIRGHGGSKFVLYFYPKDNTPGCTKCAEDFRDHYTEFKEARVEIVGVSQDTLKSHQLFKSKLKLPFQLVSDPHQILSRAFNVLRRKRLHGKDSMKLERSTFLINSKGKVEKEWRGVSPKNHVNDVLSYIKNK